MKPKPPKTAQLPLSLGLKDSAVFANFLPGPNAQAVAYLRALSGGIQEPAVYLWGKPGTGKSHLLQALCHAAGEKTLAAVYLPMRIAVDFPCEVLNGLESMALVCIDDLHLIAGHEQWQRALIGLFERIHDSGGSLVVAANSVPGELGVSPHLASRLSWGIAFQIKPLDDQDKAAALQLRTERRGFHLRAEVARYLVRHYGDDMTHLFEQLDILDQASLAAKRKLTLPFVKGILQQPSTAT